jgi:hypothetical protein
MNWPVGIIAKAHQKKWETANYPVLPLGKASAVLNEEASSFVPPANIRNFLMNRPIDVIDGDDTGDEVLRRFRFQMEFAALQAIALLENESIAVCIYCEQIEDVLVELKSGQFIGKQIKTREVTQSLLKSSDENIEEALAKFCRQDAKFPGHFISFHLVTNFSFFIGEGGDCIHKLVACGKGNPPFSGLTKKSTVRKQICRIAEIAETTPEQVLATLAKLELEEMLTGVDIFPRVVQALSEQVELGKLPYWQLLAAAKAVVFRMWEASSKAIQSESEASTITISIAERAKALTLANKRIDRSDVLSFVEEAAATAKADEQELLVIRDYLPRRGEAAGLSRMVAKMAAGNMSTMNVEQFKDDVRSLEATFLRWKEKYDLDEANRRLRHLEQLALQQCRKVHNETLASDDFPHPVITDVVGLRDLLDQMVAKEQGKIFGCRPEHLTGAVGMITEECRVWWSKPFLIEPSQ